MSDNEVSHLNRIMQKVQGTYKGRISDAYETADDMAQNIARSCSSETSFQQDKETAMYVDKALENDHSVKYITSVVAGTTAENHRIMIEKLARLSIFKIVS